jgi:hypothetical protein
VQAWIDRCMARDATMRGMSVPELTTCKMRLAMAKEQEDMNRKWFVESIEAQKKEQKGNAQKLSSSL